MSSERTRAPLALMILVLVGCADLERGDTAPDAAGPVVTDGGGDVGMPGDGGAAATSFARDVHPLLLDGCGRCHTAGGMAASSGLLFTREAAADRQAALTFVNLDQPAASRLLSKGAGIGHGGGAVYAAGTPEYDTILRWIAQGASP
jgi:hypothetical protein